MAFSQTTSQKPEGGPPTGSGETPLLLLLGVPLMAVVLAAIALYLALVKVPADAARKQQTELVLRLTGISAPVTNQLAPAYTDADGDRVADRPADPNLWLRPATLRFSYVAAEDADQLEPAFRELLAHLASVTGRPVDFVTFRSVEDQLRAVRDGSVHLTAFNTGNVPRAVNVAGFVPLVVFGDASGDIRHRSLLIVPAASPIRRLADVRGGEVFLTEPGSNSGYRSPLLTLRTAGLLPERDYRIRYTGGHDESIATVATGQAKGLTAVASDVLDRAIARGAIAAGAYRVIATSEAFPSAALGHPHHLDPEIARALGDGLLSFAWTGSGLEREFAPTGRRQFVPVAYKDDFALVRRIDDDLGVRHRPPQ